jgi:hypothetical protein
MQIPSVSLIQSRLQEIFPEGTEQRTYLIREMAAKTVFVCLYAGAIEGADQWIRPNQVCRMSESQSKQDDVESRKQWYKASLKPNFTPSDTPWFADTTREPIRDESIGEGFLPVRAMIERQGLPITSPKPRYCLELGFAKLFNPDLEDDEFSEMAKEWRKSHLSKAALARQSLVASGAVKSSDSVQIRFPNGETRSLSAGPSSIICKAVIEEFSPRFLKNPHVLWLSESKKKVVARDEQLAASLGIVIEASKVLPDIILVDLGDDMGGSDLLVVFAEAVASDGPVNRQRKALLTASAKEAGFEEDHLAFLTAFLDRDTSQFKKAIVEIAWGSYAWFVSEPDQIIDLRDGSAKKLSELK